MVFSNYSETQKEELAVSLACMLLNDGDVEVNATNINSVLDSASVTVAPYWPMLFANNLKGDLTATIISNASSGAAAGSAQAAGASAGPAQAAQEEKKKEESEEETGNVGGLFDDDDDY